MAIGLSCLRARASLLLAASLLSACGASQPYSLDIPPVLLAPASAAGIADGRARFREIFCAVQKDHGAAFPYDRPCDEALHRLGYEPPGGGDPVFLGPARVPLRIVVVPGIFGECVQGMARPFEDTIAPLKALGWTVQPLDISGRSSSAANAEAIRSKLRDLRLRPGEKLVLVGYSKGMSDLIELLGNHPEQVIPPGSSIVSVTGVVAGTPIADGSERIYRAFWWVPIPACRPGDGGGVASLTRRHRLNYLATHPLPSNLHYYSLPAFTTRENISSFLRNGHSALSKLDPRNDGNVIFHDSILPRSTLLGYANSDHWALTLPFSQQAPFRSKFFATRNNFPRVILLESIARFLEEQYLAGGAAAPAAQSANPDKKGIR